MIFNKSPGCRGKKRTPKEASTCKPAYDYLKELQKKEVEEWSKFTINLYKVKPPFYKQ